MVTMDHCRELGVQLEVFTNSNAQAWDLRLDERQRGAEAEAETFGYVSELLAKATDKGALDEELTAEDQERLIASLQGFGAIGSKAEDFEYAGSDHRGFSVHPGAGLEEGSWDTADGVEVTYVVDGVTRTISGDFCVCAVPPHIAARFRSNLAQPVKAALAHAQPVSTGKIGLEHARRWWEDDEDLYGGITNTDLDISTIWYPSYDYHGTRGTVIGYYDFGTDAETYAALPDRGRLQRALALGRKVHGATYARDIDSSFSWPGAGSATPRAAGSPGRQGPSSPPATSSPPCTVA